MKTRRRHISHDCRVYIRLSLGLVFCVVLSALMKFILDHDEWDVYFRPKLNRRHH